MVSRTWRQHIGKQTPSHFYGAEKAWNTAIQNHYALDKLKQRPASNTPALSESIICVVQWGMWIMAVKLGPYDFRDAENAEGISRNWQFNADCHGTCQILDELIKSRSLHLNQITIWTSICKYYTAKVDLHMNPACSAHLCLNGADARFCLLTLHTQRVSAISMRT